MVMCFNSSPMSAKMFRFWNPTKPIYSMQLQERLIEGYICSQSNNQTRRPPPPPPPPLPFDGIARTLLANRASNWFEPRHEKTNNVHMRKQRRRADQRLCFRYLDSTIPLTIYIQNFKPLDISSGCAAWLVSDLDRIDIVGFLVLRLIS